ncbi:hypothetical protein HPP92_005182 [Vanilla planifolia]|uniref:Uncharacterized protein n=1 Tax=Vanilla planifolia TaxID=51239 RepID=A0A835RP77_VANPL|nr:hypothetical protein HPP92_005483 [Vanilla planifolia]KAG0494188.1 hypothetical protein HPP92_005182 [Vanilla planifolia]
MERIEAAEEVMEEKLESIRPPRLEDAGLEDCALSPESIMEAFSRAAVSLKYSDDSVFSIAVDDDDHGDGCVQDASPTNCQIPDKIFCADGVSQTASSVCGGTGNQAEHHGFNDAVVVIGAGDGEAAPSGVVVLNDGGDGVKTKGSELDG